MSGSPIVPDGHSFHACLPQRVPLEFWSGKGYCSFDVKIVPYGDNELNYETNKQLFAMAQTYLVDSKRFDMRVLR